MATQSRSDNRHVSEASLSRELVESFGRLTPHWIKWLHRTAEPAGLTPARLRVLATLRHQGPSIMHALAQELGVTPRNITESWWDDHIDRTSEIFDALGERDQRTLLRILQKLEGPLAAQVG